jgi:hypothetical protein
MEQRTCLQCGQKFAGRSDKRFCGDQCRAAYNNSHRADSEKVIVQVNKVLRKNRTILRTLNPVGMTIVRKEFLTERGFNFRYFTNLYKTKEGNEYWFCYDVGYMHLDEHKVRIVDYQKYMKEMRA